MMAFRIRVGEWDVMLVIKHSRRELVLVKQYFKASFSSTNFQYRNDPKFSDR